MPVSAFERVKNVPPQGTQSLVQGLYLCQSTRTFRENLLSFKLRVIGLLHAKNTDAVCNQRTPEGTKTT